MKKILLLAVLAFVMTPAFAQEPPVPVPAAAASAQPVEISAAKSLEWNRKAKTYTAHENVLVKQGELQIKSDTLTAHYSDADGMTDISTLEADSNVAIISPPYTATGDHAVYNVKTGNAVMTGKDLKITMEGDVLTAQDKIEFFSKENKMTASGQATATHGGYTLNADALDALFVQDAQGKMVADKITGKGNVSIKSAKETATGDSGVYDVRTQKAVLTGKVRILQGENWLEGTRADVDMVTGISRLSGMGDTATDGRVKGVFYPKPAKEEQGTP